MPLGFSYQPGAMQSIPTGSGQRPAVSGVQPQGPANILSLRIPRNVGPSPIAPRQLLTSPGAQGAPDLNALIGMLLRTMQPPTGDSGVSGMRPEDLYPGRAFGVGNARPLQGAGVAFPQTPSSMPPPRITPGEEGAPSGPPPPSPDVNYGSPWATGVTPMPGEGSPEKNPYFYGYPGSDKGLF